MTIKRNIAVAIEPGLLKKAQAVAARRGTSVSALVASELGELLNSDRAYEAARKRAKATLQCGFSFQGARMNDKAVAHERRREFESLRARDQILIWRRVLAISEYSCGLLRVWRLGAKSGHCDGLTTHSEAAVQADAKRPCLPSPAASATITESRSPEGLGNGRRRF